MEFSLEKISSDRVKVVYRVFDAAGVLRGSVSVPPQDERDFLVTGAERSSKTRNRASPILAGKLLAAAKRNPKSLPRNKKAAIF
jgi:hypothetical protein